jgi:hypothetical protein
LDIALQSVTWNASIMKNKNFNKNNLEYNDNEINDNQNNIEEGKKISDKLDLKNIINGERENKSKIKNKNEYEKLNEEFEFDQFMEKVYEIRDL